MKETGTQGKADGGVEREKRGKGRSCERGKEEDVAKSRRWSESKAKKK